MENTSTKQKTPFWKKVLWGFVAFTLVVMLLPKQSSSSESSDVSEASTLEEPTEASEPSLSDVKRKSKEEIDGMLSKLKASKDDFEDTRFYKDPATTSYVNHNSVHLYLGRSESDYIWPRLVIQYAGENWLFVEFYKFLVNDNTLTIIPDEKISRDNNGEGVWEVVDKMPNKTDLLILRHIAESDKPVKMRYQGRERVFDRTISDKEKKSLKRMLDLYEQLQES